MVCLVNPLGPLAGCDGRFRSKISSRGSSWDQADLHFERHGLVPARPLGITGRVPESPCLWFFFMVQAERDPGRSSWQGGWGSPYGGRGISEPSTHPVEQQLRSNYQAAQTERPVYISTGLEKELRSNSQDACLRASIQPSICTKSNGRPRLPVIPVCPVVCT